jgi:DNA-binding transcriptional LysR family regulator
MKVTLRQLQVFDAVTTFGSVLRAADKLGMSQSAASHALKELEADLGRPLFAHAPGRPLQITAEGRRLKPMVRSLLEQAEELERDPGKALRGRLVVGATALVAETVLPKLCVQFRQAHPEVEIVIKIASGGDLLLMLGHMELETALMEYGSHQPDVELTKWRTEELWLVVAPSHPLAAAGKLSLPDLAGHFWCSREPLASTAVRLRVLFPEDLGILPAAIEVNSDHAVRLAAIEGGGIACLSDALVREDVEAGRLVRLHVAGFDLTRAISLARPKGLWRRPLAAAFDNFLLA